MNVNGKWYPERALHTVESARRTSLYETASFLLQQANKDVPYDTGMLQSSGHASVATDGSVAAVSYDTPYAVSIHEAVGRNFGHGRKAKWLQLAFQNNTNAARELLVRLMKARWPR
jgi:hypothetical protein